MRARTAGSLRASASSAPQVYCDWAARLSTPAYDTGSRTRQPMLVAWPTVTETMYPGQVVQAQRGRDRTAKSRLHAERRPARSQHAIVGHARPHGRDRCGWAARPPLDPRRIGPARATLFGRGGRRRCGRTPVTGWDDRRYRISPRRCWHRPPCVPRRCHRRPRPIRSCPQLQRRRPRCWSNRRG